MFLHCVLQHIFLFFFLVQLNVYNCLFSRCFRNVPIRQLTADELVEIEKKVSEIEKVGHTEDVDEDDAG